MSNTNCCFLTYIEISQEAGKVIWYSHLFKKNPQFVVIHTVKGFDTVNKASLVALVVESASNVGDPGLIPGLGRSPGEGNGNPLRYSCLENPMERGAWWPPNPWGCKESYTTEQLTV